MNRSWIAQLLIGSSLILVGCFPPPNSPATSVLTNKPTPVTLEATGPIPTTALTASSTLAPTDAPATATLEPPILARCATNLPLTTSSLIKSGVLIFRFGPDALALSSTDTEPTLLTDLSDSLFEVSPFTGTFAWGFYGDAIYVRFPDGEEKQISADPACGAFRQWLTGDKVILDVNRPRRYDFEKPFPAMETYYELDLKSGQAISHTVRLADRFAVHTVGALHDWRSVPVYDPGTASKVIYARHQTNRLQQIVMWDMDTNSEVWSTEWGYDVHYAHFAWDPNNRRAAIVSIADGGGVNAQRPELRVVSVDGNSVRLTQMAQAVQAPYSIVSPIWSPDGTRIAFILTHTTSFVDVGSTGSVSVVELATGMVTDFCTNPIQWWPGLVWSPDSSQVAFIAEENQLTVLDVEQAKTQVVYQIPTTNIATIKGWIAEVHK